MASGLWAAVAQGLRAYSFYSSWVVVPTGILSVKDSFRQLRGMDKKPEPTILGVYRLEETC